MTPANYAEVVMVELAALKWEYTTLKPVPSKRRCFIPPTGRCAGVLRKRKPLGA
jgi:hypothetical protein